jgi:hypothetical protein
VYLSAVASALITESSSLAQLTQHSDDLRSIYSDAVKESGSNYVSTCFGNLRAAKHRFESMCTPLSRIVLDWEASISFLARVSLERSDRAGVFASATLGALDEELMLQAALLADAADECMCLIRFFDQREVDNAKIAGEVKRFMSTIAKLFFEEHVWVVEGHTKITLNFLQKTTNFVVHGILRSVGGPRAVTRDLRDRVLKRSIEPTTCGVLVKYTVAGFLDRLWVLLKATHNQYEGSATVSQNPIRLSLVPTGCKLGRFWHKRS